MKIFVLLIVLGSVALSSSTPFRRYRDVSLGYKYQPGYSSSGGSFLNAPGANSYQPAASGTSFVSGGSPCGSPCGVGGIRYISNPCGAGGCGTFGTSQGISSGISSGTTFGGIGIGSPSIGNLGFVSNTGSSSSSSTSTTSVDYRNQQAFFHQAPIVSKHFYVHSAPEDHDEQQIVKYLNIGQPKKNYKVVFINTPSSNLARAKIIANVAPTEDKTAIYVLSKKVSDVDVSAEVVTQAPVDHKPDVYFIKYKTPQEAEHAQHVIQSQYDSLGGSSDFINEGTLPVQSVIGSLGDEAGSGSQSSGSVITTGFDSGSGSVIGSGTSTVISSDSGYTNHEATNAGSSVCHACSNVNYLPPGKK